MPVRVRHMRQDKLPLQATGWLRLLLLAQRGLLAALPQAATVITYHLI
ncbi:hypothetical protein RvVAR0630_33130 [Agrobacterium vitis]|nr:hypothetical protein RvVAR0630_33130 [Agrobacterium vitis]